VDFKNIAFSIEIPEFSFFGYLVMAFWMVTFVLCAFIFYHLYKLSRREPKYQRWKYISDTFIRNAIFFEEGDHFQGGEIMKILGADLIPTPKRLQKLLPNRYFRRLITADLLSARENMSGTAATNIKKIFYQLKLDKWTKKMLESNLWHIKAAGIQQVGIMGMQEFMPKVSRFVNNNRRLLRVEAQNTLLKLSGFEGLRFLDKATYPISEWQQIRILEDLSQLPAENFTGIDKWLKSQNDTVVIFALKLSKVYFRFELYDEVLACLAHNNAEVRRQAILTCTDLQTAETAQHFIAQFPLEDERNKLAIINALSQMGAVEAIPFLASLLDTEDNKIIIASAYSLASMGDEGMTALESHPQAGLYPLDRIIIQIKSERS
jgi:hypothetical protein